MKKFLLSLFCTLIFSVAILVSPAKAEESLGGYTLDSIDVKTVINNDSTFVVTETITGDFLGERHGLYRDIPRYYNTYKIIHKVMPIEVLSVTKNGVPEPYENISNGAYLTIKIGDPEKIFSGHFVYVIKYKVSNAMIYEKDGTVTWYWNVAEDKWDAPIMSVTSEVVLPDGSIQKAATCWGGWYSETGENCEISADKNSITSSTVYNMTMLVNFQPPGLFYVPSQKEIIIKSLKDNWDWFFLLLPLIAFFILYRIWSKNGRDPKGRGTIIAEYEPPDGLSPFETSSLYYSGLKDSAVTATMIDLAVRGYLKIEEQSGEVRWYKSLKYKLIKLKEVDNKLRDFEKDLLKKVFAEKPEIILAECRTEFVKARLSMDKMVWESLTEKGYVPCDPDKVRSWYIGFGGLAMVLAIMVGMAFIGIFERYFVAVGFGLIAIELFVFGAIMTRRTQKGADTNDKIKGFKLFLTTAEKYRIQWQEKEGTFEKLLPYAIVFGVADKWLKTFAGLMQESPTWYVGTSTSFSFTSFNSSLNSFVQSSTSLTTPSSSGGGSSGGGGGGGGGGSW
ncbi:MAG: DUF2207 domain-containing protein [Candidatus Uhrbacteria bacterium]